VLNVHWVNSCAMQMQVDSTSSQSRVVIATLVGIGIETAIVAPILMVLYTILYRSSYIYAFVVTELEWMIVVTLCVIVPVVYSAIVSPRLRPKRIVSPLTIQVSTVAIVGATVLVILIIKIVGLRITNMIDYLIFLGILGVGWLLAFALFGLLGFWQTLVVRWLVGLNEGKPNDATYTVDVAFEVVRAHATKSEFCDFWGLKLQDHSPEIVLKSRFSTGATLKSDVVLVIAPLGQNKTLIHGSAFAEELYDVAESDGVSLRRDRIIDSLVGMLPGNINRASVKNEAGLIRISHRFVEVCTRSKVTRSGVRSKVSNSLRAIREMSRIFLYAIAVTLVAWVLVDVLFWLLPSSGIEFEPIPVIEVNVGFLLATVIELIVPAWEQTRQGKPRSTRRS